MSLDWILLGFRILSTIVLYTFLGIAFYIIWRDLKSAEIRNAAQTEVTAHLRVIATAEEKLMPVGEVLPLQPVTLLGRDPENTIALNDASARHARLSRENGVWWLEDLDSQNGTLLNGLPLSKSTPLANGDIIGIGSTRFRLESISKATAAPSNVNE